MKAIYKAVRDHRLIVGTAEQIGAETRYSANYVRLMARAGRKSSDGWRVELVTASDNPGTGRKREIYTAEKDGDDPLTGTAEELSEFLGITPEHISYLGRNGRTTRSGWRIRRATDEEREEIKDESDA